MLDIQMLPAKEGDAIWIRWGNPTTPHQMIIDMGTEATGKIIRNKILALPEYLRSFELLVVTHVDRDHIGGVLTCVAEGDTIPELKFKDVWFNGWTHLNGGFVTSDNQSEFKGIEAYGGVQGERLAKWLKVQPWNAAFDGKPCTNIQGKPLKKIVFPDALVLTVLGPTPDRLTDFIEKWKEEVEEALKKGTIDYVSPGLEIYGREDPPKILNKADLLELANSRGDRTDVSKANGSSISLLLEYKGKKVVLSGDAYSEDLVKGMKELFGENEIHLDAFKLPHHGSLNNVSKELIESVSCSKWLISTDGTRFKHPDAEAISRIIAFSKISPPPEIIFNSYSKYSGWWKNDLWKTKFNYTTEYGDIKNGYTLSLLDK